MKLIASGVTRSAAIIRSPSFSRSSSSTRITMRPTRISSIARRTTAMRSAFGSGGGAMFDEAMFDQGFEGKPRGGSARGKVRGGSGRQAGGDQAIDVFGDQISFQVDGGAGGTRAEVGD